MNEPQNVDYIPRNQGIAILDNQSYAIKEFSFFLMDVNFIRPLVLRVELRVDFYGSFVNVLEHSIVPLYLFFVSK